MTDFLAPSPYRVYLGGGWGGAPQDARIAYRYYLPPAIRDYDLGVRLARRCL